MSEKKEFKYTARYFKEDLPEWKRLKDPFTTRIFYRPLSFVMASIATRIGLSANTVSYISIFISIFACIFIAIPNNITLNIIGAILVLLGVIFNFVDIVIIYCFLYYFLASVLMISKYIIKSIKRTREIESIEKNKN